MKKIALITGVTGQDGAYLSEFLLNKGYEVHGVKRRTSIINTSRIDHLYQEEYVNNRNFFLHYGDLTDSSNIIRLIKEIKPDEIYNLAAMSHVKVSFEIPEYVADVDGLGTLRILEAVRLLGLESKTKIYQASTSELYGKVQEIPQSESTPFYPRSPYGVAKLYAFWISKNYRESYNMYVSNGILFNHESPLRGETFVTRKITMSISRMAFGKQKKLLIGNLDAKRDWGHARDYVEMMWLILQQEIPDDYVIATGETHTVRDFIIKAFKHIGVSVQFEGKGLKEKAIVKSVNNTNYNFKINQIVVEVDSRYFRPAEVDLLIGDPTKAKNNLGWKAKTSFSDLISEMMDNDMHIAKTFDKKK